MKSKAGIFLAIVSTFILINLGSAITWNIPSASLTETDPLAYNGTLAFNVTLSNYYLNSNPLNFINSSTLIEIDPNWNGNSSLVAFLNNNVTFNSVTTPNIEGTLITLGDSLGNADGTMIVIDDSNHKVYFDDMVGTIGVVVGSSTPSLDSKFSVISNGQPTATFTDGSGVMNFNLGDGTYQNLNLNFLNDLGVGVNANYTIGMEGGWDFNNGNLDILNSITGAHYFVATPDRKILILPNESDSSAFTSIYDIDIWGGDSASHTMRVRGEVWANVLTATNLGNSEIPYSSGGTLTTNGKLLYDGTTATFKGTNYDIALSNGGISSRPTGGSTVKASIGQDSSSGLMYLQNSTPSRTVQIYASSTTNSYFDAANFSIGTRDGTQAKFTVLGKTLLNGTTQIVGNTTFNNLLTLSSIVLPTCDSVTNGSIGRNSTSNKPAYCDGATWTELY